MSLNITPIKHNFVECSVSSKTLAAMGNWHMIRMHHSEWTIKNKEHDWDHKGFYYLLLYNHYQRFKIMTDPHADSFHILLAGLQYRSLSIFEYGLRGWGSDQWGHDITYIHNYLGKYGNTDLYNCFVRHGYVTGKYDIKNLLCFALIYDNHELVKQIEHSTDLSVCSFDWTYAPLRFYKDDRADILERMKSQYNMKPYDNHAIKAAARYGSVKLLNWYIENQCLAEQYGLNKLLAKHNLKLTIKLEKIETDTLQ